MNNIEQYLLAYCIAEKVHSNQYRHDGKTPYIIHPIAVASKFDDIFYKQIALLHDVLEDSPLSWEDLIFDGVPEEVAKQVLILTRYKENEDYLNYLLRVKCSEVARKIKIEDIKHNLSTLDREKRTMRDKYKLALYILEH